MLKKRGMVAKIIGNSCIVLSPEGTYARIPLPSPQVKVGAEILYSNPILLKPFKPMLLIASILILFMSYCIIDQAFIPQQAVAYISLDIDPSLEMSVDKNMRVIEVHCFNDDAMNLLKPLSLEGKGLDSAIMQIINQAVDQNYIKADQNSIIISTISSSQENIPINQEDLYQVLKQSIVSCGYTGEVRIYRTGEDIHAAAQNSKISTGKYLVYEQLVQSGNDISIEDVNRQTVSQLAGTYKLALSPNFDEFTMESMQTNHKDANIDYDNKVPAVVNKEDRGNISFPSGGNSNRQDKNVSRSYSERKDRTTINTTTKIAGEKTSRVVQTANEILGLKKNEKIASAYSKGSKGVSNNKNN